MKGRQTSQSAEDVSMARHQQSPVLSMLRSSADPTKITPKVRVFTTPGKCLPLQSPPCRHFRLQTFPNKQPTFPCHPYRKRKWYQKTLPEKKCIIRYFLEPPHNWNNFGKSWETRSWTVIYLVSTTTYVFQIFRQSSVGVREDKLDKLLWAKDSRRHPTGTWRPPPQGGPETWSPGKTIIATDPHSPQTRCCSILFLLKYYNYILSARHFIAK